jgi:hypothetical protein
MQLPADFPHTRSEAYVYALSPHLLTDDEMVSAMQLVDRLDGWLETRRLLLVCRLLRAGMPEAQILDVLTGRPPAMFRRPEDQ